MSNKKVKGLIALALSTIIVLSALVGCSNKSSETGANGSNSEVTEVSKVYKQGSLQDTKYGKVQGYVENEDKTLIWKGVPYAKAPVGELRWKAPVDPDTWTDTFDATSDGNIGVQLANGEVTGSEDCLNLDIFRPNTDETDLPVLMYIHGGNNQSGTSAEINPQKLAVNSNSIVVSVNYRLGALGFNNLPALKTGDSNEDSGNYTLLDLSKSLDWINENIEYFGGNPENITLSGFSAGGRDVMAMLISPIFEGKFQKAIAFSGGMTLADPEDSTKVIAKAIASLVVEDKVKATEDEAYQWLLTDNSEVKDYLYNLPAERLATLMGNAGIRMSVFPHLFADGTVLPKDGFETKNYNDVPVIMVTGSKEFSLFARYDKEFAAIGDDTLYSDSELMSSLNFANNYGSKLYGLFNAQESAQKMIGKYNSPIYTCDFDWGSDESIVGEKMGKVFGSFHGVWIPFLTEETTGFSALFADAFNNEGAKDLTNKFTSYITNFLWNSDPNGEGLVEWKSWTGTNEGPTQLLLNADKDKAIIKMSEERVVYEDIIKEMEADTSVSAEVKDKLIKGVLNGRWFSSKLDEHFENPSFWVE